MPNPDLMTAIASNADWILYFDQPETENFYLYTKNDKQIALLSFNAAKDLFQNGTASWTLPGSQFFGIQTNNQNPWYPYLSSPNEPE